MTTIVAVAIMAPALYIVPRPYRSSERNQSDPDIRQRSQ